MYHPNTVKKAKVAALNLQVNSSSDSDSDVTLMMFYCLKLKSALITNRTVNECFFNKFGAGTKLATMLVEVVNMYGVVVSMHTHFAIAYTNDFLSNACDFKCIEKTFAFTDAVNFMLTYLSKN